MVLSSPRLESAVLRSATVRTPAAIIGRRVQGPMLDCVMVDDTVGVRLVLDHLRGLGHRRITHVDGGRGAGADRRRAAFVKAVEAAGLEADVVRGDFTEDAGVHAVELLLQRRRLPTAVFAANDLVALGVIAALEAAGRTVPDDVSVIGYDNTFVAGLRHIALTTIDQPRGEIGSTAVQMVHERLSGERAAPRHVWVAPTLVVRSTTAPARHP
jgi:DNA-binding LacI/PurR family transcriptional regulator